MTTRVRDKLRLPSERKQTISVKTFGSAEENTQSVDVVHLCINTEHGDDVQLSAFVVQLYHSSVILYRAKPLYMPVLLMHT